MLAFVLSGGGCRGALEAGALQALFAAGLQPDIVVGSSMGAVNAAFIASRPTLSGAGELGEIWATTRSRDIVPIGYIGMAWRLLMRRDSFFPDRGMRRFIERRILRGLRTFGDLPSTPRLYVTAADLNTALLRLYGDNPDDSLPEALLASTAFPTALPPVSAQGSQLIDGGVVANVPVEIAMEKGAQTIYVVDVSGAVEQIDYEVHGIIEVAARALTILQVQQLMDDLQEAARRPDVVVYRMSIEEFRDISMWNFDHGAEMVGAGRRVAEAFLRNPVPVAVAPRSKKRFLNRG